MKGRAASRNTIPDEAPARPDARSGIDDFLDKIGEGIARKWKEAASSAELAARTQEPVAVRAAAIRAALASWRHLADIYSAWRHIGMVVEIDSENGGIIFRAADEAHQELRELIAKGEQLQQELEAPLSETIEAEVLRTGKIKRRRGSDDERRLASELIRQCEISTDTPEYLPLWEALLLLIAHTKEERDDLVSDAEATAEHREAWTDNVDHWANEYGVNDARRARVKIVVNNCITEIIGYESKSPGYTGDVMGDETIAFEAVAAARGLSVAELNEAIDNYTAARSELTARENKTRATGAPRLKWDHDRLPDENPATFAWRAYAGEAKAGTLHRGVIAKEDKPLAVKLASWLRSHPMPESIDIPTQPEWNSRRLANLRDDPGSREVIRLLRVEKRRAERARHPIL